MAESNGWLAFCPRHEADTSAGRVALRATVQRGGRRAGMVGLRVQNADATWTLIEVDAEGRLVGIANADTEVGARTQLEAAARAARGEVVPT
jgi:hypothetical protein